MATMHTSKRSKAARASTVGKAPPPDNVRGSVEQVRDNFKAWQARRGFVSPKRGFGSLNYGSKETKGDA